MEEWLKTWREQMDSIEQAAVTLERHKHNLNVMEETLNRLDERLGTK